MTPEQIERALKQTPLPNRIGLLVRRDDATRPLLIADSGDWIATIYVVRKNGLPLYLPPSKRRTWRERFQAPVVASADPMVNMLRIESEAKILLEFARKKMKARASSLKASRTSKLRGTHSAGPGRPPGILRSMEKTGSNRDRKCRECGGGHRRKWGPCRV